MRNPQSFLGLAKGSTLMFVLLSVTKQAVRDTAWSDALNLMAHSPFFGEECGFELGKRYASMVVPLGSQIYLTAGSKGQHVLGRNTLGVLLDEGNWRLEANPDKKAYELYNEIRTRISNRFRRMPGYLPAISILASSAKDESSFTETIISEINAAKSPLTERVIRFASHRIRRSRLTLSKRCFRVEYGIKNQEPRILSGWFTEKGELIPVEGIVVTPATDGASIEYVPEDYQDEFQRNPKTALQSVSGISTGGSSRLFSSISLVERAVENAKAAGIVNPVKLGLISLSEETEHELHDFLDHKTFLTRRSGTIVPLHDPDAPRYFHLDMATANVAGLAGCHSVRTTRIDNLYDKETGKIFSQYRKVVAYDFIIAITSGRMLPISIRKIQNFIFWLKDFCNFNVGKVTCDSFGAGLPLQPFANKIPNDILSLDRSKEPYYTWRSGFEENRILMLHHPLLMQEVEYLIDHPLGKIDHPEKTPYGTGSKDLTDAAAGAYYDCITDDIKTAGNVSPSDPTIHSDQTLSDSGPVMTIIPEEARTIPARTFSV